MTPTRFWCREHNQPVSWHGRDCAGCRDDHHTRMAARAARAAARRTSHTNA